MHRLSIDDILDGIRKGEPFEAVAEDYSFTLKITSYVPYICAAIHDGHQFRKSLWTNCLHTEYERWYEEDPGTLEMVHTHPIVIAGRDSRFEYDLNRAPELAIYTDAWGKQLWKNPLPAAERDRSLSKHNAFYEVIHALLAKLEGLHGGALVFDMHSYNRLRWERAIPTWNLGTANIDNNRYGKFAESWRRKLRDINLPHGIDSSAAINDTFQGNGYFLKYISSNFKNTLVLATEIAKVYCDERTGIIYPEVVRAVDVQLRELIARQAAEFRADQL